MSECQVCGGRAQDAEQWRPVVGFEGYLEVSDHGRVRSLDRIIDVPPCGRKSGFSYLHAGRLLKQATHPRGYRQLTIAGGGKIRRNAKVHHLVLEAFVGPCPPGMECCHANDIPHDNRLENLRWDTQHANSQDALRNGRNAQAARTHCKHGHELTPDNVQMTTARGRSYRQCLTCLRDHRRKMAHKHRVRMRTDPEYAERRRRRDREAWQRKRARIA